MRTGTAGGNAGYRTSGGLAIRARWMTVALVVSALFSPIVARGDALDEAIAAESRGHYKTALRIFHEYAQAGDVRAQFTLGPMYARGQGTTRDDREAALWYLRAA